MIHFLAEVKCLIFLRLACIIYKFIINGITLYYYSIRLNYDHADYEVTDYILCLHNKRTKEKQNGPNERKVHSVFELNAKIYPRMELKFLNAELFSNSIYVKDFVVCYYYYYFRSKTIVSAPLQLVYNRTGY